MTFGKKEPGSGEKLVSTHLCIQNHHFSTEIHQLQTPGNLNSRETSQENACGCRGSGCAREALRR